MIEVKMRSQNPNMIYEHKGSEGRRNEAPWHVSIKEKYRNRNSRIITCQGAIVGNKWVLTAASCSDKYPCSVLKGLLESPSR